LRKRLEQQTVQQSWTSRQLEEEIRPLLALSVSAVTSVSPAQSGAVKSGDQLSPKRGTIGIYRVVAVNDRLCVDQGFRCYHDLSPAEAKRLREGNFVRLHSRLGVRKAEGAKASDLFTYRARVLRVVDGDTLWMEIYLESKKWLKEKLRLRGLDVPELDTAEGKAARRFVEELIGKSVAVTITTTKPDKWDRYLSDVFLETKSGQELFLNNLLLENGHAMRKDKFTLSNWDKM